MRKEINELTEDEKKWMDAIAVNYIVGQSDGYQLGYAQALNDFTSNIVDYWNNSDDKPQQSVLDAIVDLGVELGKREKIAEDNIKLVKKEGYDQFEWFFALNDECFTRRMGLFIKEFSFDVVKEPESARIEPESAQVELESVRPDKESAQIEQESAQIEPESDHIESVYESSSEDAAIQPDPEQDAPKEVAPTKGYGKWSDYMGKALSTLEQNLIIKGMTEENYTLSQIQSVVRLSQQTICNRKKKMKEAGELS